MSFRCASAVPADRKVALGWKNVHAAAPMNESVVRSARRPVHSAHRAARLGSWRRGRAARRRRARRPQSIVTARVAHTCCAISGGKYRSAPRGGGSEGGAQFRPMRGVRTRRCFRSHAVMLSCCHAQRNLRCTLHALLPAGMLDSRYHTMQWLTAAQHAVQLTIVTHKTTKPKRTNTQVVAVAHHNTLRTTASTNSGNSRSQSQSFLRRAAAELT